MTRFFATASVNVKRVNPDRFEVPLSVLATIATIIALGLVASAFDFWYLPRFPAATAAAILGSQMEGAVAIAIGIEVWVAYFEKRAARAQDPIQAPQFAWAPGVPAHVLLDYYGGPPELAPLEEPEGNEPGSF